ncbi:MAG: ROK family protein [Deltaproteobacteria bacterium]|nr:ROK family protein [Deltaproteobacteria bacterium]
MQYVIGIDIGGTNLKMGAVAPDGKILLSVKKKPPHDKRGVIKNIIRFIEGARGSLKNDTMIAVGIGAAGTILHDSGIISQSPNLPELNGMNLKDELAKEITSPIFIDNDANTFAIGEGWLGSARGYKNYCCLTLGTGVGGGIVLNGKILRGSDGTAGEVGHIVVEPKGLPCGCGSRGCLEVYASATGLVRSAKQGFQNILAKGLRKSCNNNPENVSPEIIAKLARDGDIFCRNLFKKIGTYLGIVITDLVNLLNMELIVIGGGLSGAGDLFLKMAEEEMQKRALKVPCKRARIVTAECENAGIVGAAHMALRGVDAI